MLLRELRAAWTSQRLRRIFHNTGWLLFERALRLGGGLLVGLWLARYLGPQAFGTYNFALALTLICAAFATLGLDNIVVRELVREPDTAPLTLGSALSLRLLGGLVALLMAISAAALLRPADRELAALTALLSLGSLLPTLALVDLWFQARVESRYSVFARSGAFGVALTLRITLILSNAPLLAFGWVAVAEGLVGLLALLALYHRRGGRIRNWRFAAQRARSLFADSWPLIASGLLVTLYMRIDQIMLGQMVGDSELGRYAVAARIAEIFPMLPGAIVASVFPGLVSTREHDPARFAAQLRRLYALTAALGYLAALLISFSAAPLLTLLLGEAYRPAAPMLIILSWASLFSGLGLARTSFLMAENLARLHVATVLLGFVCNLGLNWLLIPRFGGIGAAIASLVAYWLAAHGACFLFPALRATGYELTRALLWPKFW